MGHDYSDSFHTQRAGLVDANGVRYVDFIKTLKPRYVVAYRDLALGYAGVVLAVALTAVLPYWGVPPLIAAILGSAMIGYGVAYILLFLHEGAHFHLAADRKRSDRIADTFIAWLIGTTVGDYRKVHWQHHTKLGTHEDSENSYFHPMTVTTLVKMVTGIRAVEVLSSRMRVARTDPRNKGRKGWMHRLPLLRGMAIHAAILLALFVSGLWWAALAWCGAMAVFMPFFGALRQMLEHRDPEASYEVDYHVEDHGAFTRMFPNGPLSASFGGAGFNRHLLHHWEPQVSYTNFSEMEAYFRNTSLADVLDSRRSTYLESFRHLFHNGKRAA